MACCCNLSRVGKAKIAVGVYFVFEGALVGNWVPLIPVVQEMHKLGNVAFGGILVVVIAGAMAALPFASYVNKRQGSGRGLFISALVAILLCPSIGLNEGLVAFIFATFMFGFCAGWVDVSMNVQAIACEKMMRESVMGFMHALYALGGIIGALLCGLLLQYGVSPLRACIFFSLVWFLPIVLSGWWLFSETEEKLINNNSENFMKGEHPFLIHNDPYAGEDPHDPRVINSPIAIFPPTRDSDVSSVGRLSESAANDSRQNSGSFSGSAAGWQSYDESSKKEKHDKESVLLVPPSIVEKNDNNNNNKALPDSVDFKTLCLLCSICFVAYFAEGSIGDWSAIYLHHNLNSSIFISSLGFVGFQSAVVISRYCSDHIVVKLGRKLMLQICGVVSAIGLLIVALAPEFASGWVARYIVIAGFTLCGLGAGVVAPSVISMVGKGAVAGMDHNDAVAYVSSIGYVGVSFKTNSPGDDCRGCCCILQYLLTCARYSKRIYHNAAFILCLFLFSPL